MADIFGLDLGSTYVKLVQLKRSGNSYALAAAGMEVMPPGALMSEARSDKEAVVGVIKRLVSDTKVETKAVAVALPTQAVFERVIELPPLTDAELASAISWEAEQYVPFPLKNARISWEVVAAAPAGGQMQVLLVAAPTALINRYAELVTLAGLETYLMQTEMVVLARVFGAEGGPTTLVVFLGAKSTDLGITRGRHLFLSASIASGSDAFTRVLSQEFGIDAHEAEIYKKTYGIISKQLGGKVRMALLPLLDAAIREIKKAIAFWLQRHPEDRVKRIVLTGGGALLPGLVDYLAGQLALDVEVGNPLSQVTIGQISLTELKSEAPAFSVAFGLAMVE